MSDTITKISSEYDMVEIMQNIGSNYFGPDLSQQRIGMFGYLTESMAHMFGATILDASARANEYNTATAQRLETLLYEASIYGINVNNAIPETMTAYIGIQTSNIINPPHQGGFSKQENDIVNIDHPICTLVLEKDTIIKIANYDFMFEYDIQIKATWSSTANKYMYSVKYLTEGDIDNTSTNPYTIPASNTLTPLSTTYIKSYVTTKNNESILLFKVNLKQMTKYTDYYTVTKNDMISLTGVDFLYDSMLSHFNVYYKENNKKNWEYIKAVSIYDAKTYDEKIVHYEILHNESKIRINFDDFTPAYNSEFRIDMYGTLGSDVNNITYSGDGSDIIITLNTVDERHNYSGLYLTCAPITSYGDGQNVPTIDEIRNRVIRTKASSNSLDAEYDLYNYIKEKDSLNDYVFIKKRSDTKERRYSAFSIPRMETSDIIPSSTLNLCIPLTQIYRDEKYNSGIEYPIVSTSSNSEDIIYYGDIVTIKAGTPLIINTNRYSDPNVELLQSYEQCKNAITSYYNGSDYDGNSENKEFNLKNTLMVLDRSEQIKDNNNMFKDKYPDLQSVAKTESDEKIFSSPYTIAYSKSNQIASFYLNSISENVDMTMIEDEINSPVHFTIDHINIYRNASMGDESYKITVSVMPNGDFTKAISENNKNNGDLSNIIMLKGFMYKTSNKQIVDGYFDFKFDSYSDDIFTFSADITIDDSLDNSSSCSIMKNLHILEELNIDPNTENIYNEMTSTGSLIPYTYYKSDFNAGYLNMNVFNLRIGIGVYYLDYDLIDSNGNNFIKTITTDSDDGIRVLASYEKNYNYGIANTHSIETSVQYPDFIMECQYESDVKIPVKYTLTNVYGNSANLINLYTDMSDFVKSTVNIVNINASIYVKDNNGTYYWSDKDGKYILIPEDFNEELISQKYSIKEYSKPNSLPFIILKDVPLMQFSKSIDVDISTKLIKTISDTHSYLNEINKRITNNFSIDYKFFRTYGPCRYFTLTTVDGNDKMALSVKCCDDDKCICNESGKELIIYPGTTSLGNLDITIEFTILIRNGLSISDAEVVLQLKNHIKAYIENLNEQESDYTIYMSNIITEMETKYIDFIKSIELVSINGEPDVYRILRYNLPEELRRDSYTIMTTNDIREYVPEYINVPLENIIINVTRTRY